MPVRISKIVMVAATALLVSIVAFSNITDYGTNLAFVQHVLSMDSVFPDAHTTWRAIHAPALQHAAYVLIIAAEVFTAVLCWIGAWRMWRVRRAPAAMFLRGKGAAAVGLTLGLALWLGGFMAIGGEWFGMWMSSQWNAMPSTSYFILVMFAGLIYLGQRDEELAT
jgi:predicted small integral membrane protein